MMTRTWLHKAVPTSSRSAWRDETLYVEHTNLECANQVEKTRRCLEQKMRIEPWTSWLSTESRTNSLFIRCNMKLQGPIIRAIPYTVACTRFAIRQRLSCFSALRDKLVGYFFVFSAQVAMFVFLRSVIGPFLWTPTRGHSTFPATEDRVR